MLYVPLVIAFCVQLAVCTADIRVIGKLLPTLIAGGSLLCLAALVFGIPQTSIDLDTHLILAFYALLAFMCLAGIGIAWLIYGGACLVSRRKKRSIP